MTLDEFKGKQWTKIYSGGWGFLTCFYFGNSYSQVLKIGNNCFSKQAIILVSKGHSSGFIPEEARQSFGKNVAKVFTEKADGIDLLCERLKREGDSLLEFIGKAEKSQITLKVFEEYIERMNMYFGPHVYVKYIVDFLPPEVLSNKLEFLQDARVHVEPVFKRTEEFLMTLGAQIGPKVGIKPEHLLATTVDEMRGYLKGSLPLPSKEILAGRYNSTAIAFDNTEYIFETGEGVRKFESIVLASDAHELIKGAVAYPGKVTGVARVIIDPSHADVFNRGDILVTGMTRPEFLPLMEKAAGFVTDAGGILSHAAIVAREMKKPCVIGTQIATKVLKDGDEVEVDAEKGVINIIKRA